MSYNNRILKFQSGGKYLATDLKKAGNRAFGQPLYYDKRTGDLIQIASEDALTRDGWSKGEVVRTGDQMQKQPYSVFNIFGWQVIDPYKGTSQKSQKQSNGIEVDGKNYTSVSDWRKERTARQQPIAIGAVAAKTNRTNRTSKPTIKVTPKGQAYWDKQYQDFKSKMTDDQKAWLAQRGIDYSSAEQLQDYLQRIGKKNIGKFGVDNKWGGDSQKAWEDFVNTTMKNNPLQTPVEEPEPVLDQPDPFGYSTTNHYGDGMALKELGFNNYSGLKNYVIANQNNQFAKDLKQRFGNDVNAWNQTDVENALGVSGTYRGGRAGDFGDIARSMAIWAGQTNAAYDTRKEASVAKPTFNTQEMLNNVKSLKFIAPEWKFSLNQGNIGASTLGDLPSTKPINLSQEFTKDVKLNIPNEVQTFGDLDWIKYAQQTGYIK